MFDILVYLYETYGAPTACPEIDALSAKLSAAGFDRDEIGDAIAWLQDLAQLTQGALHLEQAAPASIRVYTAHEYDRLGPDAIAFVAFLDAAGQLSAPQREIILERAMRLDETPVPIDKLKVIALMVLWSQEAEIDVLVLEELLDDGDDRLLH